MPLFQLTHCNSYPDRNHKVPIHERFWDASEVQQIFGMLTLTHLTVRGLSGVHLVDSDDHLLYSEGKR